MSILLQHYALRRRGHRLVFPLICAVLVLWGCSEKQESLDTGSSATKQTTGNRAQRIDLILHPTDSLARTWVNDMDSWPETIELTVDSTWRTTLSDLTLAFDVWVFKDLDIDRDTLIRGLSAQFIAAASYVPEYSLIRDFHFDSLWLFRPGENTPAVRRELMADRRKFVDGVWQVSFGPRNPLEPPVDFPENTPLLGRMFATWGTRRLVVTTPPVLYEYIQSPKPLNQPEGRDGET